MSESQIQSESASGCLDARLRLWYALPSTSMAMLWTPLNVMQGIYIKYYGFSMGAMAAILMASRVYDAIADLAVGATSDWIRERTGRRKPLVACGGILFAITALLVYVPPPHVGIAYLTFWLFAFFSGYATLMISHLAWGAEIARESHEKTALFSVYKAAGYVGLCLFYAVPLLPVFDSSAITPSTIRVAVFTALTILVPALVCCLIWVPEGRATGSEGHRSVISAASLHALVRNRPFLVLLGAYVASGSGLGIWYGMIFIFVEIYLGKGALYAPLYLLAFAFGIPASLVWARVARALGKKGAWSIGTVLLLLTILATSLLTPENATTWGIGLLLVINTLGFASFELLPGSILGDVVDFSRFKTGQNQGATYFATYMFATKAIFALGGAIGLGLAAWLGFDAHARTQSSRGSLALDVVMSVLPAILLAVGLVLIHMIPIDERRHTVIRKWLDRRDLRISNTRSLAFKAAAGTRTP